MSQRRATIEAVAIMYVALDMTPRELARAVAFRRKTPHTCDCGHFAGDHFHPEGWCMAMDDDTACECEGLVAKEKTWRVL